MDTPGRFRVANGKPRYWETERRKQVKTSGAIWRQNQKSWEMRADGVAALGLESRVASDDGTEATRLAAFLPVTGTVLPVPPACALCGAGLPEERFVARTGLYVLDLEIERGGGLSRLRVSHRKHLYGDSGSCGCGHVTRSEPGRCPDQERWAVGLSEWHLAGPNLASLIVCLSLRLWQSRWGIQEFLRDWFGIELSAGTINQCRHEAGRAVEPLEESLVEEVRAAVLAHADETTWKEAGQWLWL